MSINEIDQSKGARSSASFFFLVVLSIIGTVALFIALAMTLVSASYRDWAAVYSDQISDATRASSAIVFTISIIACTLSNAHVRVQDLSMRLARNGLRFSDLIHRFSTVFFLMVFVSINFGLMINAMHYQKLLPSGAFTSAWLWTLNLSLFIVATIFSIRRTKSHD